MTMPAQKPGSSFQAYETPDDFVDAVVRRFGPIDVDLACHSHTSKGAIGITPRRGLPQRGVVSVVRRHTVAEP